MVGGVGYVSCGDELSYAVGFEHFLGLVGVDSVEVFGAIAPGVDEDAVGAAGVVLEEPRAVVHVAVDHDPGGVFGAVAANLRHGIVLPLRSVHEGSGGTLLQRRPDFGVFSMLLSGHPTAGLVRRQSRVLKRETDLAAARTADVNFDSEPAVVHHSLRSVKGSSLGEKG